MVHYAFVLVESIQEWPSIHNTCSSPIELANVLYYSFVVLYLFAWLLEAGRGKVILISKYLRKYYIFLSVLIPFTFAFCIYCIHTNSADPKDTCSDGKLYLYMIFLFLTFTFLFRERRVFFEKYYQEITIRLDDGVINDIEARPQIFNNSYEHRISIGTSLLQDSDNRPANLSAVQESVPRGSDNRTTIRLDYGVNNNIEARPQIFNNSYEHRISIGTSSSQDSDNGPANRSAVQESVPRGSNNRHVPRPNAQGRAQRAQNNRANPRQAGQGRAQWAQNNRPNPHAPVQVGFLQASNNEVVQSNGLTHNELNKIPTFKYKLSYKPYKAYNSYKPYKSGNKNTSKPYQPKKTKDKCCGICLTEFADNEIISSLPVCKHLFCRSCIRVWLGQRSSCPYCRADVKTNLGRMQGR